MDWNNLEKVVVAVLAVEMAIFGQWLWKNDSNVSKVIG